MGEQYQPWDWSVVSDKKTWLEPCEESYYYAAKWKREGRKSVLDLGCGLGRHSLFFARSGFKTTAVDISGEAIDFVKKSSKENDLDILCKTADMKALPFSNDAFDCVFAMHSAGHCDTEGMYKVMSEIRRVLKPGGAVFMTLCSKETYTYAESGLPKTDENTVVKTEGPEQGVPHFFADPGLIEDLFSGFELLRVRHIDDCYYGGNWKNQKHYFIEAAARKDAFVPDYSDVIGRSVKCTVDRPLGSAHPRFPNLVYPVNYGYADGIIGGDGAWQDVYILGADKPLASCEGRVIAVYHRLNDIEDKWIVVPEDCLESFDEKTVLRQIDFQEKFFDGKLYM